METVCPTPSKTGGCGCPRAEHRCHGWVKLTQDRWDALRSTGKSPEATAVEMADYRWTERELLDRFGAR